MEASYNGHVDVVRVLIEAHGDVHSQENVWYIYVLAKQSLYCMMAVHPLPFYTQGGWTALHIASYKGFVSVIHVLIEANANLNQRMEVM